MVDIAFDFSYSFVDTFIIQSTIDCKGRSFNSCYTYSFVHLNWVIAALNFSIKFIY